MRRLDVGRVVRLNIFGAQGYIARVVARSDNPRYYLVELPTVTRDHVTMTKLFQIGKRRAQVFIAYRDNITPTRIKANTFRAFNRKFPTEARAIR